MKRGKIRHALNMVSAAIERRGTSSDAFSRGLAPEGYMGGYRDALSDVLLVLRGIPPCNKPELWDSGDPAAPQQSRNEPKGTA